MAKLLDQLLKEGRSYECEECHIKDWNNKEIRLHVHHIDGNPRNNNRSNLQILCPNCHSQTENWCAKNVKREKKILYCSKCGKEIKYRSNSGLCKECYKKQTEQHVPTREQLIEDFLIYKSYSKISTKYDVSVTTIHKWAKKHLLNIKDYVKHPLLGIKPVNESYEQIRKLYGFKVGQYSLNGELIAEYPSIGEASRLTNTERSCIRNVIKQKRKTANGFIWKLIK